MRTPGGTRWWGVALFGLAAGLAHLALVAGSVALADHLTGDCGQLGCDAPERAGKAFGFLAFLPMLYLAATFVLAAGEAAVIRWRVGEWRVGPVVTAACGNLLVGFAAFVFVISASQGPSAWGALGVFLGFPSVTAGWALVTASKERSGGQRHEAIHSGPTLVPPEAVK